MTEPTQRDYRERDDITRRAEPPESDADGEPGAGHRGEHRVDGLDVFEDGDLVLPATDGGEASSDEQAGQTSLDQW